MLPPETAVSSPGPYKDRKAGLTVFGLFTVSIGAVCALFIPLTLFGMSVAPKTSPAQDMRTILPALAIYGMLAVIFVWLGIGSMQARRWARALLLIMSWGWLVVGLFMMVFMVVWMPNMIE